MKVDPARGAMLTAALLCGVLGLSFLSYSPTTPAPSGSASNGKTVGEEAHVNVTMPLTQDVGLSLRINVSDHGRLISSTYMPHDLLNNNFFEVLAGIFSNAQSGQVVYETLYPTAGGSDSMPFWGYGGSTSGPCSGIVFGWGCVGAGMGGLVGVGTVGTAATRSDTNLGNLYQGLVGTSTQCVSGSSDSVIVSGSEDANTGVTLQEAGLFYEQGTGASHIYMLSHDTFPGIVVSAGNTITIQYTLSLSSPGFNYNMCDYLAGALTQPNGASGTVKTPTPFLTFIDTSNRATGFASSCQAGVYSQQAFFPPLIPLASSSPVSSPCSFFSSGSQTENLMQICVGTGTTAFVPTSFALSAQTNCNYVKSTSYDSAGNLYITSNIIVTPGATISEAALYLTLPDACINFVSTGAGSCGTYGTDTLMFMASTFSGQVVANNSPIGITFQIAASGGS